MSHKNIQQLQQKIEEIQEYIETELCKKCEDMRLQLIAQNIWLINMIILTIHGNLTHQKTELS